MNSYPLLFWLKTGRLPRFIGNQGKYLLKRIKKVKYESSVDDILALNFELKKINEKGNNLQGENYKKWRDEEILKQFKIEKR